MRKFQSICMIIVSACFIMTLHFNSQTVKHLKNIIKEAERQYEIAQDRSGHFQIVTDPTEPIEPILMKYDEETKQREYFTTDGKDIVMFDYLTEEGREWLKDGGYRHATDEEVGKFWADANALNSGDGNGN